MVWQPRSSEMSAALLSIRVGSVCNVNIHSLGLVQLGTVRFSSARLGLQCEWGLNFNTTWKWVVSFMLWSFCPLARAPTSPLFWYPLNIRLGTPQIRFGRIGLEKTLIPLLWLEPRYLGYLFGILINIPTTLARLPFVLNTTARICLRFCLQVRVVHNCKLCDVSVRAW